LSGPTSGQGIGGRVAAGRRTATATLVALSLLLVGLAGCSSLPGLMSDAGLVGDARACFRFYSEVDRRIDEAGVRDGAEHRLPGFPYLRSDRFTASFADRFDDEASDRGVASSRERQALRPDALERQRSAWIGRMAAIDLAARRHETSNLPAATFPVAGYTDAAALRSRLDECSGVLVASHAADGRRARALARASRVPDDYSALRRAVGLYPVVGIGIAAGIRSWERQNREAFAREGTAPDFERVVNQRYLPQTPSPSAEASVASARQVLAAATVDALGIPQLDETQALALARAYAPVFDIATSAEHDRFGPLQWIDLGGLVWPGSDRYWLDVDSSQPVVYHRLSFTRYGEAVLPQLVYSIWFPERSALDGGDWEAGRLDGLIWRVTLDPRGEPLIYDALHPSGCCHQFFPTSRLMPKAAPPTHEIGEWAFQPLGVPIDRWIGARREPGPVSEPVVASLALRVATHGHQLVGIGGPLRTWGEPQGLNPGYRLVPGEQLRSLPRPGGSSRSIYDPDGLVVGSERFLRFVLWPAGIDSVGTLRHHGRQPTAFIGRRHFDDADLIEQRFRWGDKAP
jgi:hypothetical protein